MTDIGGVALKRTVNSSLWLVINHYAQRDGKTKQSGTTADLKEWAADRELVYENHCKLRVSLTDCSDQFWIKIQGFETIPTASLWDKFDSLDSKLLFKTGGSLVDGHTQCPRAEGH